MVLLLVVIALAAGLFGGRLWERMSSPQCPRCAITDEGERVIDELHRIERQTIAQLTNAARATQQPGATSQAAPRFYGEE